MTHSNRNFAVAYLFLVALPVLGLVGILRSGRGLTAPASVGGTWKAQVDAGGLGLSPCAGAPGDGVFTVSQSGPNFTLSFAGLPATSASGSIQGTTITASVVSPPVCSNRTFSVIASLDPKNSPHSLSGTVSVNDCATCMPISFHAVREEQVKAKESH